MNRTTTFVFVADDTEYRVSARVDAARPASAHSESSPVEVEILSIYAVESGARTELDVLCAAHGLYEDRTRDALERTAIQSAATDALDEEAGVFDALDAEAAMFGW